MLQRLRVMAEWARFTCFYAAGDKTHRPSLFLSSDGIEERRDYGEDAAD
jgi:hypothetical protein